MFIFPNQTIFIYFFGQENKQRKLQKHGFQALNPIQRKIAFKLLPSSSMSTNTYGVQIMGGGKKDEGTMFQNFDLALIRASFLLPD